MIANPQLKTLIDLLNLSEKSSTVFQALFTSKFPLTVVSLSKITKIARSTLYDILDDLVQKALVESEEKHSKTFQSVSLEQIEYILKNRAILAQKQVETFEQNKRAIESAMNGEKIIIPKLTYSHGIESVQKAYFSSLQAKEKLLRFVWPEERMLKNFPPTVVNEYLKMRIANKVSVKVLGNNPKTKNTFMLTEPAQLREVKILPEISILKTGIMIFDDTVNFFTLGDQMISAHIENAEFSDTMKALFDALWAKY
jgi:sugar-specific transcriptional regulator TrmB